MTSYESLIDNKIITPDDAKIQKITNDTIYH